MHPIGYSSRTLQDYEKRCAQIDKETPSTVFGIERFHEYLYGHRFIVINDRKLLKSNFNRSTISCPPCIQKFFLHLQKYDFELQYSPSKSMLDSATFSRSHLLHTQPEFTENSLIHKFHFVLSNLSIGETCLIQFQLE